MRPQRAWMRLAGFSALAALFVVFIAPSLFRMPEAPMMHPMGDCGVDCASAPADAATCLTHCLTEAQAAHRTLPAAPLFVTLLLAVFAFFGEAVSPYRGRLRPSGEPPWHNRLGFATVILRE